MISEGDIDMPLYDELIERQQGRGEWQRRYRERVRRETWLKERERKRQEERKQRQKQREREGQRLRQRDRRNKRQTTNKIKDLRERIPRRCEYSYLIQQPLAGQGHVDHVINKKVGSTKWLLEMKKVW